MILLGTAVSTSTKPKLSNESFDCVQASMSFEAEDVRTFEREVLYCDLISFMIPEDLKQEVLLRLME